MEISHNLSNKEPHEPSFCNVCNTDKDYCICDFICGWCKEHPNDCKCHIEEVNHESSNKN